MNVQAVVLMEYDEVTPDLFNELKGKELLPDDVKKKWAKLCAFDLSREKELLTSGDRNFVYENNHVSEMEREYKKFIFIRSLHPDEKLPMSKEVDDFWHAHVLNTRNYQKFIDECADGKFIHHRPTVSNEENMQLMFAYINGTMVRYRKYFGEPPKKFWKDDPTTACCYC